MVDGAPALVTIAADAADATPEVPMVAVTDPESGAWLLGWKVVVEVPADPLVPAEGVKLPPDPGA